MLRSNFRITDRLNAQALFIGIRPIKMCAFILKSFTDFPWFIGSQPPSGRILRAFIGCNGSNLHRVSIESTRLRENRPHFPIPEFGLTVSFDAVSWPLSNEITLWERLKLYETCCFVIRIRHVVTCNALVTRIRSIFKNFIKEQW